jgi:hypothetical protein
MSEFRCTIGSLSDHTDSIEEGELLIAALDVELVAGLAG